VILNTTLKQTDALSVLNAAPGSYLILLPDLPRFTIVGATDSYLQDTARTREEILNKGVFEAFPDNPRDPGANGVDKLRESLCFVVQHKKEHRMAQQRYDVQNSATGEYELKVWSPLNKPVLNAEGDVQYILHWVEDVTENVWLKEVEEATFRKLKEGDQNLRFLMDFMPVMTWNTGPDGAADFFNRVFLDYSGLTLNELRDWNWTKLLHPDDVEHTTKVWEDALQNGVYYEVEHRLRKHDGTYRWFISRGTPLRDHFGKILRWYGTSSDIHEQKLTAQDLEQRVKERTASLEQQKAFADSILDASVAGVMAMEAVRDEKGEIIDFTMTRINKSFTRIVSLDEQQVIGKSYLSYFPKSADGIFERYKVVMETSQPLRWEVYSTNRELNSWFDISAAKRGENGIVITFANISEQREAAIQIEQQKKLLDNLLNNSPSGISITEVIRNDKGEVIDGKTIIANSISEQYLGLSVEEMLVKTSSQIDPNILTSPLFLQALHTLKTGVPFITQYFFAPANKWLELSVARMDEDHLINIFTDITVLKNAQLEIERSAERLKAVFNTAQSGMFTFAPVRNEEGDIVDFRFVITNPTFAAYVGQTPEVLNGELGSTWFPGYLTNGVFDMYKKTYLTGETHRTDIHYNVDQHDIYLDLQSTKVGDEVLITFTDFTPLKKAQLQLEKYVEDLKRSNANLEEFAYAASHDLKEPVRKIHFFSDRLKNALSEKLDAEQNRLFERMEAATKRMGSLIDDLLSYSQVSMKPRSFEEVDMNQLIETVLNDLDLEIEETGAEVKVDKLFAIKGHQRQLQQAFQNLIGNALKYIHPSRTPQIRISCNKVNGKDAGIILSPEELKKSFYTITVSDNGIGFDPEDAERIFNVFTRLHSNFELRGTGIGLSIVRKVIENHYGHIKAEGRPGEGASFRIFLPEE